jgi:hypothetical protein
MKLLILFLIGLSICYAQVPFPQDTIAYNERFNHLMFAAYNSQGLIRMSYTSGLGTVSANNEIYYVEEDAGGNFATVNLTNNAVDDNYSTLSIDQNDNVHICYEARDPDIFQIRYMHNISGNFSTPIEITAGGLNKATPFGKIGPDSVMHFVYYTFVAGTDNFYYRSYDNRSNTLGPEILLSNGEAGGDFEATLDVDSNGKVHIAGRSGTGAVSGPLKYFNNISGTFQEISTGVADNINYPRIRIDSNDKVHIVYRFSSRLYYINNVSGSFSTPVVISPSGQLPAGIQSLEVDDQNRLYITYQSSQAASGRGFYLLFTENGVFQDTLLVSDIFTGYSTRNSSQVITNGIDIAMFYAPGGVRNSQVICDIFMKRGPLDVIVPVELVSFTANVSGNNVHLNWVTASEINNMGFEVERASSSTSPRQEGWEKIGFVDGRGTTSETQFYSFIDNDLKPGSYSYRLKQIDFDGSFEYSNVVEVEIELPQQFTLFQNYPNPFNPVTKIKFTIPSTVTLSEVEGSLVTLKVYDLLGREVVTLLNEYKPGGSYEVEFNAGNLSSGTYFYRLNAADPSAGSGKGFSDVKKLLLLK